MLNMKRVYLDHYLSETREPLVDCALGLRKSTDNSYQIYDKVWLSIALRSTSMQFHLQTMFARIR